VILAVVAAGIGINRWDYYHTFVQENLMAMRISVDIKDELLQQAMQLSNAKTRKEAVEQALDNYIKMLLRKDLLNLRGKVTWEGDLDQMRQL
jgi:Arc/MetJ family transcription regulator